MSSPRESLLVFSDVHLGSDLNDRGESPRRSTAIDHDLIAFLAHYAAHPPESGRWRVVIAGDFIDFIGMSVSPDDTPISTVLTAEEKQHGLGASADHACAKLRRVASRHSDVFDALADVLAKGHAITVIHGNHDVEFHWDEVKVDFRALLVARVAKRLPELANDAARAELESRVIFEPWFYYWNEVAYIEHGHQYDPFCAVDHVMAPLSPLDPRRVMRGFSHVLLRYVVRRTRGMKEHGHETMDAIDYISFGTKLGVRGLFGLGGRFARAVVELFRLRREHFSQATAALRTEHERRVALLAEATRIGIDRIRALWALQVPPITRSIHGILASVLLDKLALGAICIALLVASAVLGFWHGHFWLAGGCVIIAWGLVHRYLSRLRQIDPAERMVARAAEVARLLPAAFVVMGHTHAPTERTITASSTYINLGSWAEEEHDVPHEPAYRAARTHLVIENHAGVLHGELRQWSPEGPRKYIPGASPREAPGT